MMKNRLLLTFVSLCIGFFSANAQRYVVDLLFANDSVPVYTIEESKQYDAENEGTKAFAIQNGEEITITRVLKGNESIGVIVKDGKEYAVRGAYLVLSENNPEGTIDLFPNLRVKGKHTTIEHFFTTMTPYWIIAVFFLSAIAFAFLGRIEAFRKMALLGMPVCILLASLLEIWAYVSIGSSVFWWCDYDKYGFWSSALRAIPYVAFCAFQIFSIKLYEQVLFGKDSDNEISIKPMAISMGACIPLTLIAVFAGAVWWRSANEVVASVVFLLSLGAGTFITLRRNIQTLGKLSGVLLTAFIGVYIVGTIIATVGIIALLLRLILQMIVFLGCIAAVIFLAGSAGGSGGGNGGNKAAWRNEDGTWSNGDGQKYSSMPQAKR